MEHSAFIDLNVLSEEAKRELLDFYNYLLFKYKSKKGKESSSDTKRKRFSQFAKDHQIVLPEGFKFNRDEANGR
jgi:hypothetical protein